MTGKHTEKTYRENDIQFHKTLVISIGNHRLSTIFESVIMQSVCYFHYCASYVSLDPAKEKLPTSHRNIYEALRAKNIHAVESMLRKHIQIACELNKSALKIKDINKSCE